MANPTRVALTNAVIDAAIAGTDWTRDVPNGFVSRTFPDRMDRAGVLNGDSGKLLITPAKESNRGRGQVFFDVYNVLNGIEIGISLKVSDYRGDDRPPRNSIIAGSKAEHLFGLLLAAQRDTLLPVLQYWQDAAGQWWRCCFDAGRVLRDHGVNLTAGWGDLLGGDMPNLAAVKQAEKLASVLGHMPPVVGKDQGGAVAVSPLKRGGGKYVYLNCKISHHASGHDWVAVDAPAMPADYGELLDWMGEAGEMIG